MVDGRLCGCCHGDRDVIDIHRIFGSLSSGSGPIRRGVLVLVQQDAPLGSGTDQPDGERR